MKFSPLKSDKVLSKKPPTPHLRVVPDYLLDATAKEANEKVKLARAAMGNNNPGRRGFKKDKDPLKSLSAQGPKKGRRERKDGSDNHKQKRNKGEIQNNETEMIISSSSCGRTTCVKWWRQAEKIGMLVVWYSFLAIQFLFLCFTNYGNEFIEKILDTPIVFFFWHSLLVRICIQAP
ncbi:putative RNA helicase [Rosa chinensis]|uniref:Putative RNA helicase n=1 Tax=Rosa chinensis TaxID=74649 RepID=A0A2P6QW28_ROSCH|nr:putative RNA helicase [Rosa chinensis]